MTERQIFDYEYISMQEQLTQNCRVSTGPDRAFNIAVRQRHKVLSCMKY